MVNIIKSYHVNHIKPSLTLYWGAGKSLARPGSKQARKHLRDARDFNNIETRVVIKFFFSLQGKAPKEIQAILTETLASFLPSRAKDLAAPLIKPTGYVMHQQFNIQELYALPTLNLCVLYLSENKQRLVPLTA